MSGAFARGLRSGTSVRKLMTWWLMSGGGVARMFTLSDMSVIFKHNKFVITSCIL